MATYRQIKVFHNIGDANRFMEENWGSSPIVTEISDREGMTLNIYVTYEVKTKEW